MWCVVKIANENKKKKAYSGMSRDCHVSLMEQTSSVSDFKI